MKLSSRSRDTAKLELQMTSMIDCVFLLLIFFMVTSSFSLAERELDSAIKVRRAAATQTPSDLQPAIVEVVRSGGAAFVFKIGGRETTDLEELTSVLRNFENKSEGAIVRAPDDAPFAMAATAIQACKNAGFALVSYVPMDAGQ